MSKVDGESLLQLLPQHRTDLDKSGLNDKTIDTWGAYSVETAQTWVMCQLGFPHIAPPALALPILSLDRVKPNLNDVILKPDRPRMDKGTHSVKYEARPKSRNLGARLVRKWRMPRQRRRCTNRCRSVEICRAYHQPRKLCSGPVAARC